MVFRKAKTEFIILQPSVSVGIKVFKNFSDRFFISYPWMALNTAVRKAALQLF